MVRIATLVSLLLAAGSFPADAQPNGFDEMKAALIDALAVPNVTEAERASLNEIASTLEALRKRSQQAATDTTKERGVPAEFSRSLSANAALLREQMRDAEKRAALIELLRDDLRVKTKYATNALGFGGGFPAVVKVTVETVRAGNKVDGLWVRCNPRGYGVTKEPIFAFNSATSPTMRNLPPGLFVLWVESGDGTVIATKPVEIGGSGSESETIRFALP